VARTLFLHIGPAKTGTSAIQHVLSRHDRSVVIYPRHGLWFDGSHHGLVLNFFKDFRRAETVRENPQALFAAIGREAAQSERNVLISSEVFPGRDVASFAAALLSHLGNGFRVEVLAVIREHLERAASLYGQRVKDGFTAEKRTPDEFLARGWGALRYRNVLEALRRSGLAVTALDYHPATSCVMRFLMHVGFREHEIAGVPARNPAPATKALVALLAINRTARTPRSRERMVRAVAGLREYHAASKLIFRAEVASRAAQDWLPDRHYLGEQFAIALPPSQTDGAPEPFGIDELEFDEIGQATRWLGRDGAALRECLRAFVRRA
jgi:hypothetical protein